MENGAALADPPADLEEKRREAEEAETVVEGAEPGAEEVEPGGEPVSHEGEPAPTSDAEAQGEQPGEGAGEQAKPALAVHVGGKLNSTVGGETPDKSEIKLRGGSISIAGNGQLKKGEVRNLLVKIRVGEIDFVDKEDGSTGEITQTIRRHIAKIIGVELVE